MKAKQQIIAGVKIVTLSRPVALKSENETVALIHETPNGFTSAVLTSLVNPKVKNSEKLNREALHSFKDLLMNYNPARAAHLWGEKFYDEYNMFRHQNPLIAATLTQVDVVNNMAHLYRIADSSLWAHQDDGWVNIFPETMLTSRGDKILSDILKNSEVDSWQERMEKLDDLSLWQYPLMGLSESPVLGYKRIPFNELHTIILSSAESKLTVEDVVHISETKIQDIVLPEKASTVIIIRNS